MQPRPAKRWFTVPRAVQPGLIQVCIPAGLNSRQARQRSITGWLTSNPARRKLSPRLPSAGRFRKMDGNILFIYGAADVLFTFNRMRDPNMPFRRADTTEFPYWHGTGLARLVEKIEALGADRMAVRFTLKEANAPFLHNLAVPFASIHSAEYAAQLLEKGKAPEINQKPVGTGPFIFRSHTKDTM